MGNKKKCPTQKKRKKQKLLLKVLLGCCVRPALSFTSEGRTLSRIAHIAVQGRAAKSHFHCVPFSFFSSSSSSSPNRKRNHKTVDTINN